MSDVVNEYITRYRALGLRGTALTSGEVTALEQGLGLPLPAAYRAYLLVAGAYPPPNWSGQTVTVSICTTCENGPTNCYKSLVVRSHCRLTL
jgi:hypothetical protein